MRAWLVRGVSMAVVLGQGVFVDDTGVESLGAAITGGAAFTALLVLVPAGIGLALGRLARPRQPASIAEQRQV
jgi:hypothetical protein